MGLASSGQHLSTHSHTKVQCTLLGWYSLHCIHDSVVIFIISHEDKSSQIEMKYGFNYNKSQKLVYIPYSINVLCYI